jgi:lipopolysaccharide export system permease protein
LPRILCSYIIREIAKPTLMALLTITFILLIGKVYELINLVLQPGVSSWAVLKVLLSFLPSLLLFAAPMAILIGVLIGVGRQVLDREILAIRASGVNLLTIFTPALALALLVSVFVLWSSSRLVPGLLMSGLKEVAKLQIALVGSLEPGMLHDTLGGGEDSDFVLYFRERDPATNRMQGITIKMEEAYKPKHGDGDSSATAAGAPPPRQRKTEQTLIFAESGEIEASVQDSADGKARQMASIVLKLKNGSIHRLRPDPDARDYVSIHFDEMEKRIVEQAAIEKRNATRTNSELREVIGNENRGDNTRGSARRILFERYAISLASFVFALVGIPLAIWVRPSGKSWGIMIAFILMLAYYVAMKLGLSMVEGGQAIGYFLSFLPNVLFLLVGCGLWWHTLRS